MITGGEGRKQKLVFRYPHARSRAPRDDLRRDKPLLLSTTNDETKATGYYRVPFTGTARPRRSS